MPAPAEGLLLPAAPDVVDRGLPKAHNMEGIKPPHRVGQAGPQGGGVAPERVERGGRDLLAPQRVLRCHPLLDNASGPARDDVEQLRPLPSWARHRHDPGDELGVRAGARGQERRLVHANRHDPGGACWVVDQRPAVVPRALTPNLGHGWWITPRPAA